MRLTVLLLIALITISRLFDLDAVLGAFAAGFILRIVMPKGVETLETKLEGVAYGFLIPVFFVVSGASIDVHAVAGNPLLLVVFIIMLILVRAVPVFVATTLDAKKNPLDLMDRLTVAAYCTTAAAGHRGGHVGGGRRRHDAGGHRLHAGGGGARSPCS